MTVGVRNMRRDFRGMISKRIAGRREFGIFWMRVGEILSAEKHARVDLEVPRSNYQLPLFCL